MSTPTVPADFPLTPDYDALVQALSHPTEASQALHVGLKRLTNANTAFGIVITFDRVPTIADIEQEIPELVWPTVEQIEAGLTPMFIGSLLGDTDTASIDFKGALTATDEAIVVEPSAVVPAHAERTNDPGRFSPPHVAAYAVMALQTAHPVPAIEPPPETPDEAPQDVPDAVEDEMAAYQELDDLLAETRRVPPTEQ